MGLRYQKKINLGKGLGINISKSGISPSYRTKRGTLSSKGYSIRSGIPGMTYRKSFSKSKKSGCMLFIAILTSTFIFASVISCNNQNSTKINEWYVGGNLHKSKVIEWKKATESNKLATCGDFLASQHKNNSLSELKIMSTNLKACIDEAVKGNEISNNEDISSIASLCMVLMLN